MRTLCEEKTKSRRLRTEERALRTTSRLPLAARTLRAMRAWFWLTERCPLHAAQSSGPVPGPEGPDNLMKDCTKSCPRICPDHVLPVGACPSSCSGLSLSFCPPIISSLGLTNQVCSSLFQHWQLSRARKTSIGL